MAVRRPEPQTVFASAFLAAIAILIVLALMGAGHAAECRIKANTTRSGQRIYHLPGTSAYALTRIDERRGERWFCTEDEARAAGWRAAARKDSLRTREGPSSTIVPNPFR